MLTLKTYYQPVPFPEFKGIEAKRGDSEKRYQAIKKSYGDFKGKTLIDICCSNGFFGFRFLQDEGKLARGVEARGDICNFINALAFEKKMDLICDTSLNGLKDCSVFDIGIYLDTHYHGSTEKDGYLEFLHSHVDICFISCSNSKPKRETEFLASLQKLFKKVTPIHKGYAGRTILKCE